MDSIMHGIFPHELRQQMKHLLERSQFPGEQAADVALNILLRLTARNDGDPPLHVPPQQHLRKHSSSIKAFRYLNEDEACKP